MITTMLRDGLEHWVEAMNGHEDSDFLHAGDHVALIEDDWTMVGLDLVMVDVEPVPGSSQCVIDANGERLTVSRGSLRRA